MFGCSDSRLSRRRALLLTGALASPTVAGCAGSDPEIDLEETLRLGRAARISLSHQVDRSTPQGQSLDEWATAIATTRVARHLTERLEDYRTGAGVWVNIEQVRLEDIDGDVDEDSYSRARPSTPAVTHRHVYEDGTRVVRPEISFEDLRDAVPRSATVSVHASERSSQVTLPVLVHRYAEL